MKNFLTDINNQQKGTDILRSIFVYCLESGKSTIPQISKSLNISVPTVTKHVNELCENGYFVDYGKIESKEGRPANIYGINALSCYFIGVDITPLLLSIAIVDLTGSIISMSIDKDYIIDNSTKALDDICKRIDNFITKTVKSKKIEDASKILNINVNVTGRINSRTGYSYSTFNTGENSFASVISEKLGYHVTIENDTRAKTYGEYCNIQGTKPEMMLCINIDMGIAMGAVINGELLTGKSGFAGEFGHTSVFDNEILCHCGKKGCLETEISGAALRREVLEKINGGSESSLSTKVKNGTDISIYDIIEAINQTEDMLCIEIIENIGFKLGRYIANLINLFNPDKIIISGLLAQTGDFILNPIKISVKKYALMLASYDTEIQISSLNYEAGVIGACLLSRNRTLGTHS
ncbi:MAG: ROK family transcriptional regulator [Rikenellaceae bacterium]